MYHKNWTENGIPFCDNRNQISFKAIYVWHMEVIKAYTHTNTWDGVKNKNQNNTTDRKFLFLWHKIDHFLKAFLDLLWTQNLLSLAHLSVFSCQTFWHHRVIPAWRKVKVSLTLDMKGGRRTFFLCYLKIRFWD